MDHFHHLMVVNCKNIGMVSEEKVGNWTLRKEEGLASRVNSLQLVLTPSHPYIDECKIGLSLT